MRAFMALGLAVALTGVASDASPGPKDCLAVPALTAQSAEVLLIDQDTLYLFANPLELLFGPHNPRPDELLRIGGGECTSCWRRYVGTWELQRERLYLLQLKECCAYDRAPLRLDEATLNRIVGGRFRNGRAFADWVTDTLVAPVGERLHYVHMGYGSIYERDEHLVVRNGRLIHRFAIQNRIPQWGHHVGLQESMEAYAKALRLTVGWPVQGPERVRLHLGVSNDGTVSLVRMSPAAPLLEAEVVRALRRLPPFTPGLNKGAYGFPMSVPLRRSPR